MPEVRDAPAVTVEPIESFLRTEKDRLARVLDNEETWARGHVPNYPARPDALAFRPASNDAGELRLSFLHAIRANPRLPMALYLQRMPGDPTYERLPAIPEEQVSTQRTVKIAVRPLGALTAGQSIPALEAVASGADEPDYGLDIGLWEDNGTDYGKIYGFGKQPFGNPAMEASSQAPFHMGFFHEAGLVYKAAPYLKRSYPEFRIHLFQRLSQFAFETGHGYWGWRFLGWAMHYAQDLTQPYHSTVMPGASTAKTLFIGVLDLLGDHKPKAQRVQLMTNRHFALEDYEYGLTVAELIQGRTRGTSALIAALQATDRDGGYGSWGTSYPRDVIAAESNARSRKVDRVLMRSLPAWLVSDPAYVFGTTDADIDTYQVVEQGPQVERERLDTLLAELMAPLGSHSRNLVRSVVGVSSTGAQPK